MTYRRDIDGLRGIAVLLVVLYHAGIPGFDGGFVGVDVFFVISGFLITTIVRDELVNGRFGFLHFYERRARRLLPALFVVLATTLAVGWFVTIPSDFRQLGEATLATVFFVSNFHFMGESGYFVDGAQASLLLHTWSLGVEEQFYLLFPVFLYLVHRHAREHVLDWIAILAALSFSACLVVTQLDAVAAFYLLPTRAWELLAGAVLATGALRAQGGRFTRDAMASTGVVAMVATAMLVDSDSAFPGWIATLPCLGAVLVIHSGTGGRSLVTDALGWRPLVYVGLISYSLYLWHRPVMLYLGDTAGVTAMAVVASFFLAAITHRLVETPFRDRGRTPGVLCWSVPTYATLAAVAAVAVFNAGVPTRVPATVQLADQADSGRNPLSRSCGYRRIEFAPQECRIGPEGEPAWAVWGDSHAVVLSPAIIEAGFGPGQLIAHSSCPPLLGVRRASPDGEDCMRFNHSVLDYLESSPGLSTVILVARWAMYANGTGMNESDNQQVVLVADGLEGDNRELFSIGLRRMVDRLTGLGKDIVIVSQVPEIPFNVPRAIGRARIEGDPDPRGPHLSSYFARNGDVLAVISDIEDRLPGVRVIHPFLELCATGRCMIQSDGKSIYYDHHHLTVGAARSLANLFRPELAARRGPR